MPLVNFAKGFFVPVYFLLHLCKKQIIIYYIVCFYLFISLFVLDVFLKLIIVVLFNKRKTTLSQKGKYYEKIRNKLYASRPIH